MSHKIAFIGAGSFGFTRKLVRDLLSYPAFADATIALMDIDPERLDVIRRACERIVADGKYPAKVVATLDRREALEGAEGVVTTILHGSVDVWQHDILIPKKYGVDTNVGDTRGPSGIFRFLRTVNPILDIAADIGRYCPGAVYLNYTNPMAMLTGGMLRGSSVKTVGLCHSVQVCASSLLGSLGLEKKYPPEEVVQYTAGINHMAWLPKIEHKGRDLYPEIKELAAKKLKQWRKAKDPKDKHWNMVRLEMMLQTGYYITESSEHFSEYCVHFIKNAAPELVPEFNIPLDEYPRRCVNQIANWKKMSKELVDSPNLTHVRSREYASHIMEAIVTDKPTRIGGNIINHGLIPNLPPEACVEVPCLVDGNGIQGCYVGNLPEVCAAYNRTNINVQMLTIEAALTHRRECIYQAAMLDPHTAGELTIDQIRALCDDLIAAHGDWLPKYR